MENNQNAVDSSFSDASLPVELLTTSAVEVFDDFFAPDWASSALLTWTPTFQTNEPIKITSRICSKVFQSLNLSQSLQYYASNRSCKYNSEYIHLSQICASLHMTRCTPGVMSIITYLQWNSQKNRVARSMASSCRGSLCDGFAGLWASNMWQSWSVASFGHYLDVSSLSVLHSKKWFTTHQKTPAKRFLGVEGMVTDWYTRRKREIAVEVGWGGHMYTVCILVTYADARHK